MMLYRQLRLAPVRAADASPSQQRLAEERRAREARIRRAAQNPPPASTLTVRPYHAARPQRLLPPTEIWPDYREPVPYETMCFGPTAARPLTAREIIDEVVKKHGVARAELASASRRGPVTAARREASWRIRHEVLVNGRQISLPEIARHLGGRDHTTVLYNIRRHEAERLARGLAGATPLPGAAR